MVYFKSLIPTFSAIAPALPYYLHPCRHPRREKELIEFLEIPIK
jgi:hypothetical protein